MTFSLHCAQKYILSISFEASTSSHFSSSTVLDQNQIFGNFISKVKCLSTYESLAQIYCAHTNANSLNLNEWKYSFVRMCMYVRNSIPGNAIYCI